MPNKNYLAGRAFEYKVKARYEEHGYTVLRMAGSHGPYDLIAYRAYAPAVAIQCKRVETVKQAEKLINDWNTDPPMLPYGCPFQQRIEIYVKKTRKYMGWSV